MEAKRARPGGAPPGHPRACGCRNWRGEYRQEVESLPTVSGSLYAGVEPGPCERACTPREPPQSEARLRPSRAATLCRRGLLGIFVSHWAVLAWARLLWVAGWGGGGVMAMRTTRTWTTKPWCESVESSGWPFAYAKYANHSLEAKGRVHSNAQVREGLICVMASWLAFDTRQATHQIAVPELHTL
jgi:hypothetical protein